MTLGGRQASLFTIINFVVGLFVIGGGGITALTDAFGNQRWVSVLGLIAGTIQTSIALWVHENSPAAVARVSKP